MVLRLSLEYLSSSTTKKLVLLVITQLKGMINQPHSRLQAKKRLERVRQVGKLDRTRNQPGQLRSFFVELPKRIEDIVNTASISVQSSSKSAGLIWFTKLNSQQNGNQSDEDQSDDEEPKAESAKERESDKMK